MSSESNRQFITHYLQELSGRPKPAEMVARFVEDEDLREHIQMFEEAFPRYELTIDDMVAEGDKVALRATFRGVQQGDFQGIPASGREVSIPVMLIYRIAGDKIVQFWLNADGLGLLQQLGAVPVPA